MVITISNFFISGSSSGHVTQALHRKHIRRELSSRGRDRNAGLVTPESQNNSIVEAQLGGTATLKCYVKHLGDHLVSHYNIFLEF